MKDKPKGILLALVAAILWGVSGVCGQYLFTTKHFEVGWLIAVRLLVSGVILLGFAKLMKKQYITAIWRSSNSARQLAIFSIFGILTVQYSFFAAILHSNAATASILQYLAPILVAIFYAFKNKRLPSLIERIAILLAFIGALLVITHGRFEVLQISDRALFWGLTSAVALAFYTVQPQQLLKNWDASIVIGWGMFIGGACLSLIYNPLEISGVWDGTTFILVFAVVLLGSLVAFYCYLISVKYIGATYASLLACAEPLSAILLAVVWLKVPFLAVDWLGSVLIIITIILLSLPKREAQLQ